MISLYIIITQHSGKGKTLEKLKRSVATKSLGDGVRDDREITDEFQGNENTLQDTIMVGFSSSQDV